MKKTANSPISLGNNIADDEAMSEQLLSRRLPPPKEGEKPDQVGKWKQEGYDCP